MRSNSATLRPTADLLRVLRRLLGPVSAPLFERFIEELRVLGAHVETGQFGAMMDVELVNDGPVTIWIDSDELR